MDTNKASETMDSVIAKVLREKPRKQRTKSAADDWYKQMLKGYVEHGAEDLKSAKAKIQGAK